MLPSSSFDILGSSPRSDLLDRLLSSPPASNFSFTIDELLDSQLAFGKGKSQRQIPIDVFTLLSAVSAKTSSATRVSHVVAFALDIPQEYACTGCTQAETCCYRADISQSGISTIKCSVCIKKGAACTLDRSQIDGEEEIIQCVTSKGVDDLLAANPIAMQGDDEFGSWNDLIWGLSDGQHWCSKLQRQWVVDTFEPIATKKKNIHTVLLGAHVARHPFDRKNKTPILIPLPHIATGSGHDARAGSSSIIEVAAHHVSTTSPVAGPSRTPCGLSSASPAAADDDDYEEDDDDGADEMDALRKKGGRKAGSKDTGHDNGNGGRVRAITVVEGKQKELAGRREQRVAAGGRLKDDGRAGAGAGVVGAGSVERGRAARSSSESDRDDKDDDDYQDDEEDRHDPTKVRFESRLGGNVLPKTPFHKIPELDRTIAVDNASDLERIPLLTSQANDMDDNDDGGDVFQDSMRPIVTGKNKRKIMSRQSEEKDMQEMYERPDKRHRADAPAKVSSTKADDDDDDEDEVQVDLAELSTTTTRMSHASSSPPVLSKSTIDLAVAYHRDRLQHKIVNSYDPADQELASRWLDDTMEEAREMIATEWRDMTEEDQARTIMDRTLGLLLTALGSQPVFDKKCSKPLPQPVKKQRKRG